MIIIWFMIALWWHDWLCFLCTCNDTPDIYICSCMAVYYDYDPIGCDIDVTDMIQQTCDRKSDCMMAVDNINVFLGGNPCYPDLKNHLEVEWECLMPENWDYLFYYFSKECFNLIFLCKVCTFYKHNDINRVDIWCIINATYENNEFL